MSGETGPGPKRLWYGLAFVVLVAIVALVVVSQRKGSPPPPQGLTFKMAAVLPLSGNSAAVGTPKREAIQLALDRIAVLHPQLKLDVVFEDSLGSPKDGVSAFTKAISVDRVGLAFVDMTTIVNACTPIADSNRVLMFAGSAEAGITDRSSFVYRVFPGGNQEVDLLARYLLSLEPAPSLFLLHTNEFYGHSVRDLLTARLAGSRVKVVGSEEYSLGDSEFRAQVTKAKESGASRIALLGYGIKYAQILKQAQELGLQSNQFVSNVGAANATVVSLPPELTEGIVFAGPAYNLRLARLDEFPLQKAMVEAYRTRFGKEPDFRVAFVYDTMLLLADALVRAGSLEGLPQAIASQPEFQGASGRIVIQGNRDAVVEMALLRFSQGKVTELAPLN